MTPADLPTAIREARKTELSRLGSSKALYADTNGEMESDAVLAAAADTAHHAAETIAGWTDEDVDGTFAAAAARERERYEAIAAELSDHEVGETPALVESLAGLETTAERLGGLVGWTLVSETKASQFSGFFTGPADPSTASLFREFGDEYESLRDDLLDALEEVCADDADWERAETAATDAVGAAYDEYVERLEAQGVNPKPVC